MRPPQRLSPQRPTGLARRLAVVAAVMVGLAAAPAAAHAESYAVVRAGTEFDRTCISGVVVPIRFGEITGIEQVPTHPTSEPRFQEPNGVWNATSEIYSSWGDDRHQSSGRRRRSFPARRPTWNAPAT